MPVEIVGNQLRIRVRSPKGAVKYGTQDVGRPGRLQRVAGLYPKLGWKTQSWRLNLKSYSSLDDILTELHELHFSGRIDARQFIEAKELVRKRFG